MILAKADIFLNSINLTILVTEMQYVYCEEGKSPHTSYYSDQFHASRAWARSL